MGSRCNRLPYKQEYTVCNVSYVCKIVFFQTLLFKTVIFLNFRFIENILIVRKVWNIIFWPAFKTYKSK